MKRFPLPNVSQLALGLYAALHDGEGLLQALSTLSSRLGASSHAVHLIRYVEGVPVGSTSMGQGGVAGGPMEEYARHWVRFDPWARAHATLPFGVHDMRVSVPEETLRRSAIWNEWGRPNDGAFHALGGPLLRDGDGTGGIYFHRRASEAPFEASDLALLRAVLPHLRRVFAAEAQLGTAQPSGALRAGLDALPDGVALVDSQRHLVFANRALRRMVAQADGLALGPEGLDAPAAALRRELGRALTAALAAAQGMVGLLPAAGSLTLPRPSGRAPWLVRALPVPHAERQDLPSGFRGAMLLVTDTARRTPPAAALLARLFGLTPAEASLAAALAAGRSLDEHATRRRIARETARTQLAAIRRKTGCRRQSELAALLARLSG